MNCSQCGYAVPKGSTLCPNCGAAVDGQAIPSFLQRENKTSSFSMPVGSYVSGQAAPQNSVEQPPIQADDSFLQQDFPQAAPLLNSQPIPADSQQPAGAKIGSYAQSTQYVPGSYPQGYQPTVPESEREDRAVPPIFVSLMNLPRLFKTCFSHPSDVLMELIVHKDSFTCLWTTVIVLLLTFFSSMIVMRGSISGLDTLLSKLVYGSSIVGSNANYISGTLAVQVGGICVLLQFINILLSNAVFLVFLFAYVRVEFSTELALGFVATTTFPTAAAALLAMFFGLFAPILSFAAILAGIVVSYVQACEMICSVPSFPQESMFRQKAVLVALSLVLVFLADSLIGGALAGRLNLSLLLR